MKFEPFHLNTSRSFLISALFAFGLSHCASNPNMTAEDASAQTPVVMDADNKIHIVNHSKDFVDTIRFKPCGAPVKMYTPLTTGIKPQEKITLNVHELCIDVVAEDAFRQTVFEQSNIRVSRRTTLNIK